MGVVRVVVRVCMVVLMLLGMVILVVCSLEIL